jgi:hypothetical protein
MALPATPNPHKAKYLLIIEKMLTGNPSLQACEVFAQRLSFVLDGDSQTLYVVSNWGLGGRPVSGQAPGYPSEERVRFQGLSFLVEVE